MSGRRLLYAGAMVAALLTAAGCGDTGAAAGRPDSARSIATPSTTVAAAVTDLSLEQLRGTVLDAVRGRSTVRLAIGNLNPPPVVQVVEDYSKADGDLEATFAVAPGRAPAVVARRVAGEVYLSVDGKPFQQVPAEHLAEGGGGALLALLRTDALRDLGGLLGAATSSAYDGTDSSVGSGTARYRLVIDTGRWFATEGGGVPLGMPGRAGLPASVPATLWISSAGLPVRLELRHSDPLDGVPGTGTSRIEYSHWGEPVTVARP